MAWRNMQRASEYASLSPKTLLRAIRDPERPLPARRVGRRWLIKESDLDQWIESHEDKPADDVAALVDDVLRGFSAKKEARKAPGPDQRSINGRAPKIEAADDESL